MLTIVLNNIRSAWNVGAIMRTCDALGAKLILIGYTPKPTGQTLNLIKKTSIGAEKTVPWQYFEHYQQVLDQFPQDVHLGIEISSSSQDLFEYLGQNKLMDSQNYLLWFGNEIHGLEADLTKNLQAELHLPMQGQKESLNVSSCVCAVGYLFKFNLNFN